MLGFPKRLGFEKAGLVSTDRCWKQAVSYVVPNGGAQPGLTTPWRYFTRNRSRLVGGIYAGDSHYNAASMNHVADFLGQVKIPRIV